MLYFQDAILHQKPSLNCIFWQTLRHFVKQYLVFHDHSQFYLAKETCCCDWNSRRHNVKFIIRFFENWDNKNPIFHEYISDTLSVGGCSCVRPKPRSILIKLLILLCPQSHLLSLTSIWDTRIIIEIIEMKKHKFIDHLVSAAVEQCMFPRYGARCRKISICISSTFSAAVHNVAEAILEKYFSFNKDI